MPKTSLPTGTRIHYQQMGEGPDLVMVHGLTGNLAVWHLQIAPALQDRFRILTYDLRGHGLSSVPHAGYSPDEMADDLLALLDALEIERPILAGHSYGADISLYFAARYPDRVRAVVAIEAALPALEFHRADPAWSGWSYWKRALAQGGVTVAQEHCSELRYMVRATIEMPKLWGPLKGLPRNPKPLLRLLEETTLPEDYRKVGSLTLQRITSIEAPVLLMYTEESALLDTFDYLLTHLPHPHPMLMPRTEWGHFGPLEQPELVARGIAEHFTRERALIGGH
jgi:pimeloyl-ACP methyl ester carboxylesterase